MSKRELKVVWRKQTYQSNEDNKLADLYELYSVIIQTISKTDSTRSLIIYDYAKLLEQEIQFYSSVDAYIAGSMAGELSEDCVLLNYLTEVTAKKRFRRLEVKILLCFNEIASLLEGNRELIVDFTETYNLVHGTVKRNIHEFIRLGMNSEKAVIA